ncbi:MAG TPA: DUF5690 family protein [Chitinophagales bacterium]|nr:DUF5690 family protein [Chitinophagales bacterium]
MSFAATVNLVTPAFKNKLTTGSPVVISLYAAIVAFCAYSCMYAFRKPFTVATFEGIFVWGLKYKDLLIIAQLLGYTLSKFLGIKIIAEMKAANRGFNILRLVFVAAISLLLFAITPAPWNIIFLFLNGIPLGMVWGIVFSFLEGRRTTEFMGSVMAVSFIFSSGFVKSIGKWLLKAQGVSEWWMPFLTALIFMVPMVLFIYLLEQIPNPSTADIEHRSERKPMNVTERKEFLRAYLPGITALIISYVMLTIIRDFRDNFAADIWNELGYNDASVFTETEIPISLGILFFMSLLIAVKNNFRALQLNHVMVAAGFAIAGLSTFLFAHHFITPFVWMVLSGLGLYLGYVPFNVMFFERKIAAIRRPANVGFLMYTADSFGYLGSMGVLLFKNFYSSNISYSNFFIQAVYIVSAVGLVFMFFSFLYFNRKIDSNE